MKIHNWNKKARNLAVMFLMHKEQRLGLKLHSNATIIAITGIASW